MRGLPASDVLEARLSSPYFSGKYSRNIENLASAGVSWAPPKSEGIGPMIDMTRKLGEIGFAGDDDVVPFEVEARDVRGRVVQLGPALDQILSRHDYPDPVARLLGEEPGPAPAGAPRCALNPGGAPTGTSDRLSTNTAPFARRLSTTWRLCTISWRS